MTRSEPSPWSNSGAGLLEIPGSWADEALCAQVDPEMFFPEKGGSTREAKRICQRCDVRAECLEYALDHDERFGIWGGLSERARRGLKKQTTTTTTTTTKDTTMNEATEDDFEVCETCYSSVPPAEVDARGNCRACQIAEPPPAAVRLVGRPPLPGWAADAAQLLVATEGHQDLVIRDVRKIAAQSLQALRTVKEQYDRLQASTDRAVAVLVEDADARKQAPKKKRAATSTRKRDPLATTTVMQQHNITPAMVREWAAGQGIPVASRGNPSMDVIEQYLTATTTKEN